MMLSLLLDHANVNSQHVLINNLADAFWNQYKAYKDPCQCCSDNYVKSLELCKQSHILTEMRLQLSDGRLLPILMT